MRTETVYTRDGFGKLIWILAAVGLLLAILAGASWAQIINNAQRRQPLRITACQPGMDGCVEWFTQDPWPMDQPIRVIGDRCNAFGQDIAYDITVSWESITSPASFPVVDARAVWPPGCEQYDFTFEVPISMRGLLTDDTDSIGRWKLIGDAVPVDNDSIKTYTWDVTGAVELVAPE